MHKKVRHACKSTLVSSHKEGTCVGSKQRVCRGGRKGGRKGGREGVASMHWEQSKPNGKRGVEDGDSGCNK